MCEVTFEHEEDSAQLVMIVKLAEPAVVPSATQLLKAFESSDYCRSVFIENSIDALLSEINVSLSLQEKGDEVDSEQAESEPEFQFNQNTFKQVIAHVSDASVSFVLDKDEMAASLQITPARGGKHTEIHDVIELLTEQNVVSGISKKAIVDLLSKARKATSNEALTAKIAEGTPVENGKDGHIEYLVDDPAKAIRRPKKLGNGKVDMRDLGGIVHVKEGTKLARLEAPTNGKPGVTVTGNKIDPIAGKEAQLVTADGCDFLDEKKQVLVATTNGMPKHLDNSVSVNQLLEIESVDVSTGNIKFDGSIYVKGNVCESMKLYATEDIVIEGTVDSAKVIANGNISVAQGIIGHQIQDDEENISNSARVSANGDISALFVQYADLVSKSNIHINQHLSHCYVEVAADLWVGDIEQEKAAGTILGCYISAGGSISTGILGSPSSTETRLDFDYWQHKIYKYETKATANINQLIQRIDRYTLAIQKLLSSASHQKEYIEKLNDTLKAHLKKLVLIYAQLVHVKRRAEHNLQCVSLKVFDTVFDGAIINALNSSYVFRRKHPATQMKVKDGQILVETML